MRLSTLITAVLLPLAAVVADSVTTSTSTLTKTITVLQVVATATSTYANGTSSYNPSYGTTAMYSGTGKAGTPVATSPVATLSKGAAPNVGTGYIGAAGVAAMVVVAIL